MIVSAGRWETFVINRHFETTASVDRKRRPSLRGQRAVWKF